MSIEVILHGAHQHLKLTFRILIDTARTYGIHGMWNRLDLLPSILNVCTEVWSSCGTFRPHMVFTVYLHTHIFYREKVRVRNIIIILLKKSITLPVVLCLLWGSSWSFHVHSPSHATVAKGLQRRVLNSNPRSRVKNRLWNIIRYVYGGHLPRQWLTGPNEGGPVTGSWKGLQNLQERHDARVHQHQRGEGAPRPRLIALKTHSALTDA
jgi:hypothetical protein